jgi:hypothetical protein
MKRIKRTVSFTASADSEAVLMDMGVILGIRIPASFGVASLTLLSCDTSDGTYDLVTDSTDTAITITTNPVTPKLIDLSDIFPLVVGQLEKLNQGYIKFRAPSSITKSITIYQGGV